MPVWVVGGTTDIEARGIFEGYYGLLNDFKPRRRRTVWEGRRTGVGRVCGHHTVLVVNTSVCHLDKSSRRIDSSILRFFYAVGAHLG